MADGAPHTHIETWHEHAAEVKTIHLVLLDGSKPHGQDFYQKREEIGPAVTQKLTNTQAVLFDKLLSEINPHRLEEHDLNDSEHFRMVHSPMNTSQGKASVGESPQRRPREVTYDVSSNSPRSTQYQSRQDSAYFSHRGSCEDARHEAKSVLKEKQLRAREKVTFLRRNLLEMRLSKRRKRVKLRKLRDNFQASLDSLTQNINVLVALNKIPAEIGPLHDRLRAAQDELGPVEFDYEEMEGSLELAEDNLEYEEEMLDNLYEDDEDESDISDQYSRVNVGTSPPTKPPNISEVSSQSLDSDEDLLQRYLSLMDQAHEARDQLFELEDEYVATSEDAKFRQRNGVPLTEEMAAILSDYLECRREILDDISRFDDQILNLREECLKRDFFDDDQYRYVPHDALRDELVEFVKETLGRSPLHSAALHAKYFELTKDFSSKKDSVNTWLLEWVQESTLDMMMLRSWIYTFCPGISANPEKTLVQIGDDRWTEFSTSHWYTDTAGIDTDANFNHSRLDLIAGDAKNWNGSNINWSLSSYSSLNVGLHYHPFVDSIVINSGTESYAFQKQDEGPPLPKPRLEKDTTFFTALGIDKGAITEQDRDPGPTALAAESEPKSQIHTRSVEIIPPITTGSAQEPTFVTDMSAHLPEPNKSTTTTAARSQSYNSDAILECGTESASAYTAKISLPHAGHPTSSDNFMQPWNHETAGAPNIKLPFPDTSIPTLSRPRSLITLRNLEEDDLDKTVLRSSTHPIRKSSSFTSN
ncbi:uncharacterized protein RAG0_06205 [Rhynchosporium agropyri]|uniref:Uncharacterized protein n=1 Tax=Rhynchosporium agropyri TaxID=914238 RepID=A0A1E1KGG4_9HELO|nr:uncharacterized protein RAG0_06205 [Rhynchosporium agropyri]